MKTFSIKESLTYGLEGLKTHFIFILGISAVSFIISFVMGELGELLGEGAPIVGAVVFILGFLVSSIVTIGMYKVFLKLHDKQPADFTDLYSHYGLLGKYILTLFIYAIAVIVGLVLFVIPGIYLALKYTFAPLVIVDDEKATATEALARSASITQGIKWKLLGFVIMLMLINFVGMIFFMVGLLITMPISMFATVYVYRRLAHEDAGEMVVTQSSSEAAQG